MKYKVTLADNFNQPAFTCSWSTTLLGDKLRAEFDAYISQYKKDNGIVEGGTDKILIADILQTFMTQEKQMNLIKDEGGQGLKSVFLLRPGTSLEIDEEGREALRRFEKIKKVNSDGTSSEYLGFMEFEEVGKKKMDKAPTVSGNEFGKVEETNPEMFKCDVCDKEFETKRQLSGHKMSHKKDDKKTKDVAKGK